MEKLYPEFADALIIGKYNERVIAHEFEFQGVPLTPTVGKDDFDFYLPDGRSLEVKIDLRSQCTGMGAVEWPTLQRNADYYVYTLTYARVYTHQQLQDLYLHGKKPAAGLGDLGYDARLIRNMGKDGLPLYQFINSFKQQSLENI